MKLKSNSAYDSIKHTQCVKINSTKWPPWFGILTLLPGLIFGELGPPHNGLEWLEVVLGICERSPEGTDHWGAGVLPPKTNSSHRAS